MWAMGFGIHLGTSGSDFANYCFTKGEVTESGVTLVM